MQAGQRTPINGVETREHGRGSNDDRRATEEVEKDRYGLARHVKAKMAEPVREPKRLRKEGQRTEVARRGPRPVAECDEMMCVVP